MVAYGCCSVYVIKEVWDGVYMELSVSCKGFR